MNNNNKRKKKERKRDFRSRLMQEPCRHVGPAVVLSPPLSFRPLYTVHREVSPLYIYIYTTIAQLSIEHWTNNTATTFLGRGFSGWPTNVYGCHHQLPPKNPSGYTQLQLALFSRYYCFQESRNEIDYCWIPTDCRLEPRSKLSNGDGSFLFLLQLSLPGCLDTARNFWLFSFAQNTLIWLALTLTSVILHHVLIVAVGRR